MTGPAAAMVAVAGHAVSSTTLGALSVTRSVSGVASVLIDVAVAVIAVK